MREEGEASHIVKAAGRVVKTRASKKRCHVLCFGNTLITNE
jgi:hypothetical protein